MLCIVGIYYAISALDKKHFIILTLISNADRCVLLLFLLLRYLFIPFVLIMKIYACCFFIPSDYVPIF